MDNINNKTPEESKENAEERPVERAQEQEIKEEEARKVPEENVDEKFREMEEAMLELEPEIMEATKGKAEEIKKFDESKQLERLLLIAQTKGIKYSIGVAKNLEKPDLLDRLHDILAQEGLYKKFKE